MKTITVIIVLGLYSGVQGWIGPAITSLACLVILFIGACWCSKHEIDGLSVAATGVTDEGLGI